MFNKASNRLMHIFICFLGLIIFISGIGFLSGCVVGPDFKEPDPPCVDGYTESRLPAKTVKSRVRFGKSQRFICGQDISACWWTLFKSEKLNCLIEAGIENSPNIKAARAALEQSKESLSAYVGANFFPNVNLEFLGERQKESGLSFGAPQLGTPIFNLFNASVNVTYLIDPFGGNIRKAEALKATAENQVFLLEAAYLSLTANIVTTAVTEASLRAQIKTTHDLIAISEKQLDLIRKQFNLGAVSKASVLAQETQLAQLRATLPPLNKNLAVTRHALAVLIGTFPSEQCLPDFYLDNFDLPSELPVSLPSELIRQRPDIRAAEALLHQANANVGVAIANLFPKISLNTDYYGFISNRITQLFNSQNTVWEYGAQVLQPFFQGGALLANRRAAIAALEQAFQKYRQVVLVGFQNVADTLIALEMDAKTLKAQVAAERAARDTLNLIQKQFKLGGANYLAVLDAERQYQQTRIARIQAQAARLNDTAALFQSLGGGWWNRDC